MNNTKLEEQFIQIHQGLQQARCICEVLNECGLPWDRESAHRYLTFAWLLEEIIIRSEAVAAEFGDEMFNPSPAAR